MSSQATLLLYTPEVRYALIEGYDGFYRVSDHGAIESYKRGDEWRPRALSPDKHGYLFCMLSHKGKSSVVYVHKLVCHYFNGPSPGPEYEVCHNSPDRKNNHYTMVRWDTHANNCGRDRVLHGTDNRGEKSHMAKLDWHQVHAIRERGSWKNPDRVSAVILAREYGISASNCRKIINGFTWIEVEHATPG